jgi:hypothetical protein
MRFSRKLVLMAAMVISALAMTASSASAVEVKNEESGNHCGPCNVLVAGETQLVVHSGGMEQTVSNCTNTLNGEIYEDGSGHITNIGLSGGSACVSVECRTPTPAGTDDEWPVNVDAGTIAAEFCLYNSSLQKTYCDAEGTFAAEPGENHNYLVTLDYLCPSGVEVISTGANALEIADHEGAPGPPYTWDAIEIVP